MFPALKEESFTSTIDNHISKIEFQLNEMREPLNYQKVLQTWNALGTDLMKNDNFGVPLTQFNGFLNDIINPVVAGKNTDLEKAKALYDYVVNNFTSTSSVGMYFSKSLRNIIKDRNGTTPDINLLMTALLIKAGFEAHPVILSTRSHGYTYELYPIIDKCNYVITRVKVEGKYYFLDASSKLGFGILPPQLYNGHARVINNEMTPVFLYPQDVTENSVTTLFIAQTPEGLKASYKSVPGIYHSMNIRREIATEGEKAYIEKFQKALGDPFTITSSAIDSLHANDVPIAVKLEVDFDFKNQDLIYFNPIWVDDFKDNPFKSEVRNYPIEIPYGMNNMYIVSFAIPEGYTVDELPKNLTIKLNEKNDVVYNYKISYSDNVISLQSRLQINRTFFTPDEYDGLRAFFNLVVNKLNENIVLK